MGGGGGGSGPTVQQQQLETEQALTTANLNLEENSQRKSILNAMSGTRVFRGSALSRAVAGNNDQGPPTGAPSKAQMSTGSAAPATATQTSLFDPRTGQKQQTATTAGGQGASAAQIAAGEAQAAQAQYAAGYAALAGR